MPTAPPADHGPNTDYHKSPGEQPLPGYRLLEPLGRGGYGEVWKCVAPGGLHKAIKFVLADGQGNGQFRQELEAFEQIKSIRHPFLLSLERVEVVGYELVMVMELADRQLADRFKECRAEGLPGIPRDELLGYFAEAAEALDLIGTRYGLQHLDVKPANLFLTCGHVKVGDYGLVSRLDGQAEADPGRGLTPKYVAPEVLLGRVHTRSDQYSLALVYFELLTGDFPYSCRTAQQLLMQHTSAPPNLSPLPESDREAVGTALRKGPEERFPSCREFVRALRGNGTPSSAVLANTPRPAGAVETPPPARPTPTPIQIALGETTERQPRPGKPPQTPPVAPGDLDPDPEAEPPFAESAELTCPNLVRPACQPKPDPGSGRHSKPPEHRPEPEPEPEPETLPEAVAIEETAPAAPRTRIRIRDLKSVSPVGWLGGHSAEDPTTTPEQFASAVLAAATAGGNLPHVPGDIRRLPDGSWVCRFASGAVPAVAALKMGILHDRWGVEVRQPDPDRLVLRRDAPPSTTGRLFGAFSKKKGGPAGGLEVTIVLGQLNRGVGEATVGGRITGAPDAEFVRSAEDAIPKMIEDVWRELGNIADPRKHPRVAAEFPLTVHPLHSDGTLDPPLDGRCRDVSAGGLSFATTAPVSTKYVFVEFGGVKGLGGLAILAKLVRSQTQQVGDEFFYGAQYRTDL